jgi:hypothetical protein
MGPCGRRRITVLPSLRPKGRSPMASPAPAAARATQPTFLRRSPIPVPWNAELFFYVVVELVVGIVCLAFESINGRDFLEVTKWTSAAYLLARGIAKASRVPDAD